MESCEVPLKQPLLRDSSSRFMTVPVVVKHVHLATGNANAKFSFLSF